MYGMYIELNCFCQNSYVEALGPSMTVFGDRAFKEVIRVKRDENVGALKKRGGFWGSSPIALVSLEEETLESFLSLHTQKGKTMWKHNEKAAMYN